jgi:hypothetical protein
MYKSEMRGFVAPRSAGDVLLLTARGYEFKRDKISMRNGKAAPGERDAMPEPIRIGIVICDRYRTCAGGKCLRALHNREGAFSRYRGRDVRLVGYITCLVARSTYRMSRW